PSRIWWLCRPAPVGGGQVGLRPCQAPPFPPLFLPRRPGRSHLFRHASPATQARQSMRVTLERSHLLRALNHAHRVVERRNTIPILANVLLRAEGGTLSLKATDLDLEALESVTANIAQAGSTTVPAHLLYEIVRKLPEGG